MDNSSNYWCLVTELNEGKSLENDWLPFWRDICVKETENEEGVVTYEMYHNKERRLNCCFEEFRSSEDVVKHVMESGPKIGPTFAILTTPQQFNQCGTRICDEHRKLGEGHAIGYFTKKVDGSFRRPEYHIAGEDNIRYESVFNVKPGTSVEKLTEVIKSITEATFKNNKDCLLFEYFVSETIEDGKEYQMVCHSAYENSCSIPKHWQTVEPYSAMFNDLCSRVPDPLMVCGPLTDEVHKLMTEIVKTNEVIVLERLEGRIKR